MIHHREKNGKFKNRRGFFMMNFITNSMRFFSEHIFVSNIVHAAGGFGLAVVLQKYLKGNPFVSVYVGWALLIVALILHVYSMMA